MNEIECDDDDDNMGWDRIPADHFKSRLGCFVDCIQDACLEMHAS